MKDDTRQWLHYAEENLSSAKLLIERKLYNPCLQNTQQAIEKMLKALLIEKGVKIKKTHSISELVKLLNGAGVAVDISEDDCDLIDSIYLPSKYPVGGILPDYEPDDEICRRCLDIAAGIQHCVESCL